MAAVTCPDLNLDFVSLLITIATTANYSCAWYHLSLESHNTDEGAVAHGAITLSLCASTEMVFKGRQIGVPRLTNERAVLAQEKLLLLPKAMPI